MSNSKNQKKYPDRARPENIAMRKEHLASILRNAGFYSRQLGLDDITDADTSLKVKIKWIQEEDFSDETVERFTLALEEVHAQAQLLGKNALKEYFHFLDALLLSDQKNVAGSAALVYGKLWLDIWLAVQDADAAFRASIYYFKAYVLDAISHEQLVAELEEQAAQTIESVMMQGMYGRCNAVIDLPEDHALSDFIKHYPDARLTVAVDENGKPLPLVTASPKKGKGFFGKLRNFFRR
jgi:hypothetical protein